MKETSPVAPGPEGNDLDLLLDVRDLTVSFPTDGGEVQAVRGVSYQVRPGEALGIVGESGAGKSVSSMAVLGLLPGTARISGSIRIRGDELIGKSDKQLSKIRGRKVAMIFQDPLMSLNPVYTVGYQIAEAVRAHSAVSAREARNRAVELLREVSMPLPEQRIENYPHELSGGMRQRVVIAIAIANEPDVIIADEPTSALDATVQAQVLEALEAARAVMGAALVLVTHDLGVVARYADRVGVMYAGKVIETGSVDDVFYRPRMPYTLGLLGSQPRLDGPRRVRLSPITGVAPSSVNLPPGCPFARRCPLAEDICEQAEPDLRRAGSAAHLAACHFHEKLADAGAGTLLGNLLHRPGAGGAPEMVPRPVSNIDQPAVQNGVVKPVVSVRELVKHFPVRSGGGIHRTMAQVHAVCGVSFDLFPHETLGLVGESGCGKTTVGRLLLRLLDATSGSVRLAAQDLTTLSSREMRPLRRDLQIVFQDPSGSLDPRMTVNEIVGEPLWIHGGGRRRADAQMRVRELLHQVGLDPEHGGRYPHEFSGGQQQRISIARALALRPKVLVLDEPMSALDVSVQARMINLLADLQDELGLSYLLISHSLAVVRHIADRAAVMYLGKLVEAAPVDELFVRAAHPYTQALISAIPRPDPRQERARKRILLTGDVPSHVRPPSGCRFRTRCPKFAGELSDISRQKCVDEEPELVDRGPGHAAACHFAEALNVV